MGNHLSSPAPKQGTPSSSSPQDPPKPSKRDSKSIIPVHTTQRVAAPPEPSLAQAIGSNSTARSTRSLPQSIPTAVSSLTGTPPSSTSSSSAVHHKLAEAKPVEAAQDAPSKPVDVPSAESTTKPRYSPHVVDAGLVSQSSIKDMSYLTRPPRLPLPIEEEIHTPGSPIISATDIGEVVADLEALDSDGMTRKSSALSTESVDEDDIEELRVDKTRPTVPTRLVWRHGGEKVYVTGTIFQWNRKQRLHPVEGKPGHFAGTVHVLPGTHHVRFLVDGIMATCPDLPTTVDFGNNLVNYIEVNADDLPVPAPGQDVAKDDAVQLPKSASQIKEEETKLQRGRSAPAADLYSYKIPQYLIDFDSPEESPANQNAMMAMEKLPSPPALPGFLGKPILNAALLMKEDNSVLNMPSHTVLNHLMTSSIKNHILAVSATTRYKSKYVTTIVYKPTGEDAKDLD